MPRKHQPKSTIKSPLVDVCILTAGKFDMLRKCLDSVELQSKDIPLQVYVLDNGSSRQSRLQNIDVFERPNIKYRRSEINMGFPSGSNELARMGNAPLILFLNDDVVLQPGALDVMVRRMDDPTIGVCGAKLTFPLDSTDPRRPAGKVQHVGVSCNLHGDPFHLFMGWNADNPRTCQSKQAFAVTGACMMVRRSIFNKIGGFFIGYGVGTFEDIELCLIVREMGYKIFVDAEAKGSHHVGATAEMLQQAYPLQMNSMLFRSRNAQRLWWSEALDW